MVEYAFLQSHQDNNFANREKEKDTSIMKQIRVAREELNLAQKNMKEDT